MNNHSAFLIRLSAFAALAISLPASAALPFPLPLHGEAPEIVAAAMLSLAAVAVALLQQRRAQAAQERGNALERQLHSERGAHAEAENALSGSHEVLCRLVRQQESVRQTERARIARDLHDELGHRLLSLRVELALQQAAVRGTSPAVYDKLTHAIAKLDAAIRSVRALVGGLRPIAPGQSLRQAAERHLADFARLHGLDYRFDAGCMMDDSADRERDAVLLRVLQESLSNVARHARATMVCVTLAEAAGEVVLKIEDDGIGTQPASRPDVRSCGIDGMRERTEAYGGSLTLAPGRRGGTVVCASLPLFRTTTYA
ncbi:sensor histidine kinase [Massilia sp. 9I]|uniref:sensor histidine kinase n=1 Tax=Massilia sp. 9I TaxID=2653152 RepID=UPI0012EFFAEE|nr:sensor histidine kinase [Massilia sp. 9I]VXB76092.1 Response regulator receiver sensor signal transduction histidine kinase [Massilia sp. 9I]